MSSRVIPSILQASAVQRCAPRLTPRRFPVISARAPSHTHTRTFGGFLATAPERTMASSTATLAAASTGLGSEHKYAALFQAQAKDYAAARPTYSDEMYEAIIAYADAHGNTGRDTVADIACGSGQASVKLATLFKSVIGIDASPAQVAQAPPAENMRYELGTAEDTNLAAGSCDLVTVAQALHWFDLSRFYPEAARILKPRGTLAIWTYAAAEITNSRAANDALFRVYDGTLGSSWDERRKLVDALYVGLEPTAPLFEHVERKDLTLRKVWRVEQLIGYVRSWSAYNIYLRTNGVAREAAEDPARQLETELREICSREGISELDISWPLPLILATRAA